MGVNDRYCCLMDSAMKDLVEAEFSVLKKEMDAKWKMTEMNIIMNFNDALMRIEEQMRLAKREHDDLLQSWTERLAEINGGFQNGNSSPSSSYKRMELRFRNKLSSSAILTGEEIKGEGDTFMEVALLNSSTNEVVEVGPEASGMVKIVVLKSGTDAFDRDDWNVDEFKGMIVEEVQGKGPILGGNPLIKLQGGIAILKDIKFKNDAIKLKQPSLRLGACFVETFDGVSVKEAKTESFRLRDFRYKYNRKHEIPSLNDEVRRLRNIRKGGEADNRLKAEGITTVEEFLIQLLRDDKRLKDIVRFKGKNWDATVNHARKCLNDGRRYRYVTSDHSAGIVFDIFGQVQGLYSRGDYVVTSKLSKEQQIEAHQLYSAAISKWDEISLVSDKDPVFADNICSRLNEEEPFAAKVPNGSEESFGVDDLEIVTECKIMFPSCSPNSSSSIDLSAVINEIMIDFPAGDRT